MSHSNTPPIWFFTAIFLCVIGGVKAFGAGEIPSFSYCHDSAYRHGDIEGTLEDLVRWEGGSSGGGGFKEGLLEGGSGGGGFLGAAVGILGAAASAAAHAGGGAKFSKQDVKRVYFGNWLRDYSQAMDIAGLSKATADTIVLVISVLGFMTFGYATEEFGLTEDKLGVYLTVEHIDNPKGYGGNEDPRKYHPKLRPPVDPKELEIDQETGMKNYIAKEGQSYDTAAAHVRRSLLKAIELARNTGGRDCSELFEAYRLLGGALHTLEDLLAHSNWCELTLKKMGHDEVFCHVGENVKVRSDNGEVPPLVTGTFGSADFIFSVMGEAQDKLSESSISELDKKMKDSQNKDNNLDIIKQIFSKVGGSGGDQKVQQAEEMKKNAIDFDPSKVATAEVQKALKDALVWRDGIMRDISKTIENVPGLEDALESLTEAVNLFVYTTIQPYVQTIMSTVQGALSEGSREVIDQDDQYEVFDKADASDPSHSMISKDHFDNVLNDPAGRVAKVVVREAVSRVVKAWSGKMDPNQAVNEILETFHHPYIARGRSGIQGQMADELRRWYEGMTREDQRTVIERLSKQSVRDGNNKRIGAADDVKMHGACVGKGHGGGRQSQGSYGGNTQGSYGGNTQGSYGGNTQGSYGGNTQGAYGGNTQASYGGNQGYGGNTQGSYGSGRNESSYGSGRNDSSYGSGRNENEYGSGRNESYGSGRDESSYGSGRNENEYASVRNESYGSGRNESSYGSGRNENEYGSGRNESYGSGRNEDTYGGRRDDNNEYGSGRNEDSYGSGRNESSYGGGRNESSHQGGRHGEGRHESSYGSGRNESSYGSGRNESSYGSGRNEDTYGSGRNESSYGSGRNEDSYGSGRHESSYSSGRNESLYSGGRDEYGGGRNEDSYGGGYGGRGGDSEETYGVDRMNLREDDDDDNRRRGEHHGGGNDRRW